MADIFVMPRPLAVTGTLFWSNSSQQLRDLLPPSVLDYPPPYKGPLLQFLPTKHFCDAPTSSFHQNVFFG